MIHNDQIYQVTHPQCPTTCISLLDLRNIINLLPQTNNPPLVTKVFSQCNILSPPSLSKFRPHPIKHFSSCLLSTSVQIMQSQVVLMCCDAKTVSDSPALADKENRIKSLFGWSHFASFAIAGNTCLYSPNIITRASRLLLHQMVSPPTRPDWGMML